MADLLNFFKKFLLQTHQSECHQIWVTTLGQGLDVKLQRSCQSHDWKCVKMADSLKILENRVNSFINLPHQTHQSEFYHIWVTALGQGQDKLQVQWSYFYTLAPWGSDFGECPMVWPTRGNGSFLWGARYFCYVLEGGALLTRVLLPSLRISPRYLQHTAPSIALSGESVGVINGYSTGNLRRLTWVDLGVLG